MAGDILEAATERVAAAERRAVDAREGARRMAEEVRQLVAVCFEQVNRMRHQSQEDTKQAHAMLAEARELLARAGKLAP